MTMTWVDPKYAHLVAAVKEAEEQAPAQARNCTICQGVGRIIMDDGQGGTYSITCMSCSGSGQVPDEQ